MNDLSDTPTEEIERVLSAALDSPKLDWRALLLLGEVLRLRAKLRTYEEITTWHDGRNQIGNTK